MNTTAFRDSGVCLQWVCSESAGAVIALVTAPQQEGIAQMNTTATLHTHTHTYIYIYMYIYIY